MFKVQIKNSENRVEKVKSESYPSISGYFVIISSALVVSDITP